MKTDNNGKKNKNRACNTAHRYGELIPIAYFGTQLYCLFFMVRNVVENEDSIVIDVIKYIISNISFISVCS